MQEEKKKKKKDQKKRPGQSSHETGRWLEKAFISTELFVYIITPCHQCLRLSI